MCSKCDALTARLYVVAAMIGEDPLHVLGVGPTAGKATFDRLRARAEAGDEPIGDDEQIPAGVATGGDVSVDPLDVEPLDPALRAAIEGLSDEQIAAALDAADHERGRDKAAAAIRRLALYEHVADVPLGDLSAVIPLGGDDPGTLGRYAAIQGSRGRVCEALVEHPAAQAWALREVTRAATFVTATSGAQAFAEALAARDQKKYGTTLDVAAHWIVSLSDEDARLAASVARAYHADVMAARADYC